MNVLDTKEQSVRVKKLLSAHKNAFQYECALDIEQAMRLKMNQIYSIAQKRQKIKLE